VTRVLTHVLNTRCVWSGRRWLRSADIVQYSHATVCGRALLRLIGGRDIERLVMPDPYELTAPALSIGVINERARAEQDVVEFATAIVQDTLPEVPVVEAVVFPEADPSAVRAVFRRLVAGDIVRDVFLLHHAHTVGRRAPEEAVTVLLGCPLRRELAAVVRARRRDLRCTVVVP
jgi:hypothetical protein